MSAQQPTTATEEVVARAWRAALDVGTVAVTDNFFDLGGHSVLLHMVRERLVRDLGRDVALVDLFRHPTIRAVAAHLDGTATPGAATTRPSAAGGRDRLRTRRTRRDAGVTR